MDSVLTTCESLKELGNKHLGAHELQLALDNYGKAIEAAGAGNIPDDKLAIYYANRAYCHIKMENYGLSLRDANESIRLNKQYPKGYYRAGSAYLVLGKNKEAYDNYLKAFELGGRKDAALYEKLKEVKAELDEQKKEQRLKIFSGYGHHMSLTVDWRDIQVADYTGPRLQEKEQITSDWVIKLMEFLKDQKKLHKRYVLQIIQKARNQLEKYASLVDYPIEDEEEFTICGDIHGQYYDLLNIFKINGNPSAENKYLFNGDFVDRGSFSVECMITLLAWKCANNDFLHLTRGNHEARTVNMIYGFKGEVQAKYSTEVYDAFSDLFCHLPLSYVINKKVMICHGGIFADDGVKLEDIRKVNRVQEPPEKGIMCDLLWADPSDTYGRQPSKRGVSMAFGPDITKKFLSDNNLDLLIRSHEVKQGGYQQTHGGKCITIFSAPNYCDQMGNKGAFIRLKGKELKPKYTQFDAVPHPNIKPMAYSHGYSGMF